MRKLDRETLKEKIEQIANYDLENKNVFGSSYFVFQGGSTVFQKHFGFTGLDGSEQVNDGTIYRLASMTKPITAVAIAILTDRGLVSLQDPVAKFLPEFETIEVITAEGVNLGKPKTPVTVLHCLTHSSGLGSGKTVGLSEEDRSSIEKTVTRYVKAGLDFEPFSTSAYSPYAAFDVLAAIVERVTGQGFEAFLKQEIFEPCSMTDTTFVPSKEQWGRMMTMHQKAEDNSEVGVTYPGCIFEDFPDTHCLAGAGLVSTLKDYANFATMLLQRGKFGENRILSEQAFEQIPVPYILKVNGNGNESWGLGMRVIINEAYETLPVGSFGWSGAYGSHFWIDPENDLCAVFLKNSRFDGGAGNHSACRFEQAVFDALK